jgi:hypothetical protein
MPMGPIESRRGHDISDTHEHPNPDDSAHGRLGSAHSLSIDFRAESFDTDTHRSNGASILVDASRHPKYADSPSYLAAQEPCRREQNTLDHRSEPKAGR